MFAFLLVLLLSSTEAWPPGGTSMDVASPTKALQSTLAAPAAAHHPNPNPFQPPLQPVQLQPVQPLHPSKTSNQTGPLFLAVGFMFVVTWFTWFRFKRGSGGRIHEQWITITISDTPQPYAPVPYLKKLSFLRFGSHTEWREARKILQFAKMVDEVDFEEELECSSLCHCYHRMVELTFKYGIERWGRCPAEYESATGFRKYPPLHNLRKLSKLLNRVTTFKTPCLDLHSLNVISSCAVEMSYDMDISCAEFWFHVAKVDPYLQQLWDFMDAQERQQKHITLKHLT